MSKCEDRRIRQARVNELRELYGTQARDLANQLLDAPFEADDVMYRAFQRLRGKKESELPGDDKLPALLADIVLRICLKQLGHSGYIGEAPWVRRANVTRIPPTAIASRAADPQ